LLSCATTLTFTARKEFDVEAEYIWPLLPTDLDCKDKLGLRTGVYSDIVWRSLIADKDATGKTLELENIELFDKSSKSGTIRFFHLAQHRHRAMLGWFSPSATSAARGEAGDFVCILEVSPVLDVLRHADIRGNIIKENDHIPAYTLIGSS
jgi:hypothetical protein